MTFLKHALLLRLVDLRVRRHAGEHGQLSSGDGQGVGFEKLAVCGEGGVAGGPFGIDYVLHRLLNADKGHAPSFYHCGSTRYCGSKVCVEPQLNGGRCVGCERHRARAQR